MGKYTIWLRVSLLVVAFIAVLIGMHYAQEGKLAKPLQAIGLTDATSQSPLQIDLCPTRISSIELSTHVRIYQEGREWMKKGSELKRLPPVTMEKWLAVNCHISAERQPQVADSTLPWETVTLSYVDGSSRQLERRGRQFRMASEVFSPQALESALVELETL